MTREHKLAMIVGFALVLVVGVLVSDHLSGARKARMANLDVSNEVALSASDADVAFGRHTQQARQTQRPQTPTITRGPAPEGVEPVQTVAANNQPATVQPVVDEPTPVMSGERLASAVTQSEPANTIQMGDPTAGRQRESGRLGFEPLPAAVQTEQQNRERLIGMGFQPVNNEELSPVRDEQAVTTANNTIVDPVRTNARKYVIKEGDTLWSIASDEYGNGKLHEKLAAFNKERLGSGGRLREGGTIYLPEKAVLTGEARPSTSVRVADAGKQTQPMSKPAKSTPSRGAYVVKSGDTLEAIAKRELGSPRRWEEILELNSSQLDDETSLRVGMTLKLPKT